jgi:hypothetical protein
MKRLTCPICYGPSAQVLEQYVVNVDALSQRRADKVEQHQVGGLQVFKCSNAHIFFIRACDITVEAKHFRAAA